MIVAILLLVGTGLSWVSVGVAVGHVERKGWSLVRFQILLCIACVALCLAGYAAAPTAFLPQAGCPASTWALVIAGTLLCGVFNYMMNEMLGRGMKKGPNAIVWAIVQSGLIYPFLMGWLVFGVPMGPRRVCGIAMIVASVFLYAARRTGGEARRPRDGGADASRQPALRGWLPAALLGMVFCGINQCGANLPSYLEGGTEFSGTFRTMSVYLGLLLAGFAHLGLKRATGERLAPAVPGELKGLAAWAAGVGLLAFLTGKFLTFPGLDRLERLGAGSMGYPVAVAACIAGFFPYGVLVLRERIDSRQAAGAAIGLAGILVGCL